MCRRSLGLTGVCQVQAQWGRAASCSADPVPDCQCAHGLERAADTSGQSCRSPTFSPGATGWIARWKSWGKEWLLGWLSSRRGSVLWASPAFRQGTAVGSQQWLLSAPIRKVQNKSQHQCWQSRSDFLLDSFYGQSWLSKSPNCYSWDTVKKSHAANSARKIKNKKEDLCLPLIVQVFPQALQAACPSCWDGWLQPRR